MLAVTTSEILKRSVWRDDFQAWPTGDTEKATVLRSFHTSVLNRWSRWLTFPDVRVYYLFPACVGAQESGGLTWRLEKHQTEFRENVNHTSVLTANLSPCRFSTIATVSSVCKSTDKTTLYTTYVHAGINQRCCHQNAFGKLNRIVKREDCKFFNSSFILQCLAIIVRQVRLFAAASHSWKKCELWISNSLWKFLSSWKVLNTFHV